MSTNKIKVTPKELKFGTNVRVWCDPDFNLSPLTAKRNGFYVSTEGIRKYSRFTTSKKAQEWIELEIAKIHIESFGEDVEPKFTICK